MLMMEDSVVLVKCVCEMCTFPSLFKWRIHLILVPRNPTSVLNVARCVIMSTLRFQIKDHKKQQQKERENWREKCQLFQRIATKQFLLQQLLVPGHFSQGRSNHHRPPTALSGPFCLHAQSSEQQGCWQAEVKWCACWPAICVVAGRGGGGGGVQNGSKRM